jgi:hypothetical protein
MSFSPLPIKEQITQAILTSLNAVVTGQTYTIGDTATTKTFQVTFAVERVITNAKAGGPDGNVPADWKVVLREGDDREPGPLDKVADGGDPIRFQGWLRPYCATIFLSDSDPNIPFDQKKNVASAELLNALLVNRQLGGLCEDIYPRGTGSFEAGDDMTGIDVNFEVHYRTAENDCYAMGE